MTSVIRPATVADIGPIAQFLSTSLGGAGGPARYRRYFSYSWLAAKPDLGMMIDDAGNVRGFVGAIYSDRRIGATTQRFCNITSAAVEPSYRKHTLALFGALLAPKQTTFTCFSPNEPTQKILDFFKFRRCSGDKVIFGPLSGLGSLRHVRSRRVITDPVELDRELTLDQREIAHHHRAHHCGQLLIVDGDRRCFVVTARRGRDVRVFANVLHASDPSMLVDSLPWIHGALLRAHGTLLTGVDQRWIHRVPWPSYPYRQIRPIYLRSSALAFDQLDALYTELALAG